MSAPIHQQVVTKMLLLQIYQNLERLEQLTRDVERITEKIRKAQNELSDCEAQRKVLMDVVRDAVLDIDVAIGDEPIEEDL